MSPGFLLPNPLTLKDLVHFVQLNDLHTAKLYI